MNLGNKISELRRQQQLSQEKLGEKVGVTRQTISNWELNETIPDTNQLKSLSGALQISIDKLVDNDIQDLLEHKIDNVEQKIVKNKNLVNVIVVLSLIIVSLVFAFISSK